MLSLGRRFADQPRADSGWGIAAKRNGVLLPVLLPFSQYPQCFKQRLADFFADGGRHKELVPR